MSSPQSSLPWRLLVDENLPRSLTTRLHADGYDVEDARDVGLRCQDDSIVFAYAQTHSRAIVTLDKGIGNIQRYPKPHAGIVAARLPERMSIERNVDNIVAALAGLAGQSFADAVVIIEPGRVRVRR